MQSEGRKHNLFLQMNLMKHLVGTKNSTWILKIQKKKKNAFLIMAFSRCYINEPKMAFAYWLLGCLLLHSLLRPVTSKPYCGECKFLHIKLLFNKALRRRILDMQSSSGFDHSQNYLTSTNLRQDQPEDYKDLRILLTL